MALSQLHGKLAVIAGKLASGPHCCCHTDFGCDFTCPTNACCFMGHSCFGGCNDNVADAATCEELAATNGCEFWDFHPNQCCMLTGGDRECWAVLVGAGTDNVLPCPCLGACFTGTGTDCWPIKPFECDNLFPSGNYDNTVTCPESSKLGIPCCDIVGRCCGGWNMPVQADDWICSVCRDRGGSWVGVNYPVTPESCCDQGYGDVVCGTPLSRTAHCCPFLSPDPSDMQSCCGNGCCHPANYGCCVGQRNEPHCCISGPCCPPNVCCGGGCFDPGSTCCGNTACPPGEGCCIVPSIDCSCPPGQSSCCIPSAPCGPGTFACGSPFFNCCNTSPAQACCGGGCMPAANTCCGTPYYNNCPPGEACCNGNCCPVGVACCGLGNCCGPGNCCGAPYYNCCALTSECCGPDCCPAGKTCCGTPFFDHWDAVNHVFTGSICCNTAGGETCCGGNCCPAGQVCSGEPFYTCCPEADIPCGWNCCSPSQTCSGTPRYACT